MEEHTNGPDPEAASSTDREPLMVRVAAAMAEAAAVTKGSENKEQGYKFASAEAILGAVRVPLLERGIVLIPSVLSIDEKEITARSGSKGTRIVVDVAFTFTDGREELVANWRGEGQDYGDKALGKAFTNAVKTFIRSAWLLPTEHDDPEASSPGERVGASELPVWALESSKARYSEAWIALAGIVGEERTAEFIGALGGKWGYLPDGAVAIIKAIVATIHTELDPHGLPEVIDSSAAAHAASAAQEAATEPEPAEATSEAPETPREDESGPVVIDFDALGKLPVAQQLALLKTNGCICNDPLAQKAEHPSYATACPILGHGQHEQGA